MARRFYYSFVRGDSEFLVLEDIERFFPTPEDAIAAFSLFDKDGNGDVSRDEMEMTCLYVFLEAHSSENFADLKFSFLPF